MQIWTEYLSTAYPLFLASENYDIDAQQNKLLDRYREAGEATRTENLAITEEVEIYEAELKALDAPEVHLTVPCARMQWADFISV